jgi:HEAT repeat protein
MSFEEALAKVAAYEVGDSREALYALSEHVAAASPLRAGEMERALVKALESKATLAGKDQICRHLSEIGSAASVPALSKLLGSADTADMARYALERIPGAGVDRALRVALPKSSGKAQIGIVNTIGRRGDAGAVPELVRLVTGRDADVGAAAAAALGQIATPAASAGLASARRKTSGALREEIDEAYLRCGEQLVEKGDKKAAMVIFKELSGSQESAMIRAGALRGLAMAAGKDAVPVLTASLKAAEPNVRAQAVRQLSSIPGNEGAAALTGALPTMDPGDKVRALSALADRGGQDVLPAFLQALKDGAPVVRVAALRGLGKIGNESVILPLAETAAADAGSPEQSAAETEGARTGGLPNERDIPIGGSMTEQAAARQSLWRLPGAGIDKTIIAAIATAEPKVKVELIRATSERGISAATETLIASATDSNREVRRAAMRALRGTARPSDVPALLSLLAKSERPADRSEATRALSSTLQRWDTASLDPVMSAYRSTSDVELRGALLTVLAQTGRDESLPVLRTALKDSGADIRRGAILALSEWPTAVPAPDLLDAARNDPSQNLQILSLRGYIRLIGLPDDRPQAETVRLLSEAMGLAKQADEKKAVLALVARINSPQALALAEAAMNDAEVAAEAKLAADRIRQRLRPARKRQ